jgi:TolB protein
MPTFAPDGEHIFFSNRIDIWSVSLSDLSLRSYPQPGTALDPVVSHDGNTVYYMASIRGDFWLCSLRLDVEKSEQQTLFNLPAGHLEMSPDGKRFAMSLYDSSSNLWSVPLDPTTDQPTGPPTRLTEETNQRNTLPSYSPDGETVVFNRFSRGTKGSIWAISPDGTNQREIYSQPGVNVRFPQWTLDGRSLYVQSAGRFHLLNLETRRLERYAAPFGRDWLQWDLSPDGKRIAFSREIDAVTNIWVVDAEGGDEKQITFDPEYAAFPEWSPDSEQIAFELSRGGHIYLAIVSSSGGEIRQLTFEPEHSWQWGWSPDRSKIAFAGSRSGVWNIWWVSLSEDSMKQLTEHEGNRGTFVRYPTWSPKGDQIVYERTESTADIWFLDLEH